MSLKNKQYDLFVIGGGSGGVRAARLAAARGKKVALAEKSKLGGTCVNVGCVPKKLFYYAAGFATDSALSKAYGWSNATTGTMHWQTLIANKNTEINRLNKIYEQLLANAGVEYINEHASLKDKNTVQVGDQIVTADHILLASGGVPTRLSIPGAELAVVSDDLFFLPELPKRIVIIGGGYIALEFAGIFAGLGSEVTITYRADLPMRGLDEDIRQYLAAGLQAQNINIIANKQPAAISEQAAGKTLTMQDGQTITADLIVSAIGRRASSDALNLQAAGIEVRPNGTIPVNDSYQTNCPSVYAVGDLLNTTALTPVAIAEAMVFIDRVFDGKSDSAIDYDNIPTAVFSHPSFATAGLSEAAAIKRGLPVAIYTSEFRPMKSSFGGSDEKALMKLIVHEQTNRIIGAQMVGEGASEIMQGIAIAITAGATKQDFDNTIGIHPSSAEEFVTLRERTR